MTRYYTRPRAAIQPEPLDHMFAECNAAATTVYEPEDPHLDSGLLNARGEPLYRRARNPIGFLWRDE